MFPMRVPLFCLWIVLFLLRIELVAGQVFESHDSAGVVIILSGPPREGVEPSWEIQPEPILQIGAVEGDPAVLFSRVWDALRTPAGRVVVVEKNSFEIRVFAPDGQHLVTFGRRGRGPEEFAGPPWISLVPPDTLVVWDPGQHRLSHYTLFGHLLGQRSFLTQFSHLRIGPFPNGRVWQVTSDANLLSTRSVSDRPTGAGLSDRTRHILLFLADDETSVDFGTHAFGQTLWIGQVGGPPVTGMPNPFAPFSAVTIGPKPFVVSIGEADEWGVRSYDEAGNLRRILRSTVPRTPVSPEVLSVERERIPDEARVLNIPVGILERGFRQLPLPETLPPIASLFWDTSRNLWVGRRTGSYLQQPSSYDVFDADGHWLAHVQVPEEINQIFEVGEDYLLALITDELDVPAVRVYHLEKGTR